MNTVFINVSGIEFECSRKVLNNDNFRNTVLYRMCEDAETSGRPLRFRVDRSSDSFAAVLAYYQTERLHMPLHLCPGQFKEELEYWGIDPNKLESCCLYRYFTFLDDMKTHQSFRDSQKSRDPLTYVIPATGFFQAGRQNLWNIVDNQDNTILSKLYSGLLFFIVVVSIVAMAYSTEPGLRSSLTICEYGEYLKATGNTNYNSFKNKYGNINCDSSSVDLDEFSADDWWDEYFDYLYDYYYDTSAEAANTSTTTTTTSGTTTTTQQDITTGNSSTVFPRVKPTNLPVVSKQHYFFDVMEYFTISCFTCDFLLRILSCPSLWRYFTSVINVLDACALVASFVHLGVVINHVEERYISDSWVKSMEAMQILRVLRILRIAKNVRASRVLSFSVRQNAKDMLLLAMFLLLSVSFFSNVFYFLESRETIPSIPQAWYWAIITLTTVGYGDISPKSGPGRLVASICAVTGVLLLAITLPMFVNNFLTLYHYSSIDDTIERKKKATDTETGKKHSIFRSRSSRQVFVQPMKNDEKQ